MSSDGKIGCAGGTQASSSLWTLLVLQPCTVPDIPPAVPIFSSDVALSATFDKNCSDLWGFTCVLSTNLIPGYSRSARGTLIPAPFCPRDVTFSSVLIKGYCIPGSPPMTNLRMYKTVKSGVSGRFWSFR